MGANQLTFLEELEPRIAPATFVTGVDGTTIEGTGAAANLEDHASDAALVGYTAPAEGYAFLLKKGDKLVVDTTGNGLDKNDATLISVEGGSALFFFGDHDSNEATPFVITGVSVSDKFSGSVNATIHGGVVTALSTLGHLTMDSGILSIQSASLTKLTVTGFVDASVSVGGSIGGMTISGYSEDGYSVDGIYAGSATNTAVDQYKIYLGGQVGGFDATFSTVGVAGGSIGNVLLAGAAKKIYAGDAQPADSSDPKSKPLAGGSISNVTVQNSVDLADSVFGSLEVRAGNGSGGATQTNDTGDRIAGTAAGAGGSISMLTVKNGSIGDLTVKAGFGGAGGFNAAGGAGGAINGVTAKVIGASILAGDGGQAGDNGKDYNILDGGTEYLITTSGAAGVGGSVTGVTLTGISAVDSEEVEVLTPDGTLTVYAAAGIFAGIGGDGGAAGGSITKTVLQGTWFDSVVMKAGDGSDAYEGTGKAGGASGSITGLALKSLQVAYLALGSGDRAYFDPGYDGISTHYSFGGNGAQKFALKKVVVEGETFYTQSTTGGGVGGAGGSVSGILADTLAPGRITQILNVFAGSGGSGAHLAAGGNGGAVSGMALRVQGEVEIFGGFGGSGGILSSDYDLESDLLTVNATGTGGSGGNVSKVALTAWGTGGTDWSINGGDGSGNLSSIDSSIDDVETGGNGGSVSDLQLLGSQVSRAYVVGGNAGEVTENSGHSGSAGGNVSNVTINVNSLGGSFDGAGLVILAGEGSSGADKWTVKPVKNQSYYSATATGMAGGAGGFVFGVSLLAPNFIGGEIAILGGDGGAGSTVGNGGAGGKVEKVDLNATYAKKTKTWSPNSLIGLEGAEIHIEAGDGGDGKLAAAGGLINDLRVFATAATIEIESGDGGDAYDTLGSKDGAGGNISNISAISVATDGSDSSRVGIFAGDAGNGEGYDYGSGAAGGSISNLSHVAGYHVSIGAGAGSTGTVGGKGGDISGADFSSELTPVKKLSIEAGAGGEGLNGAGGAGGSVSGVTAESGAYVHSLTPADLDYGDFSGSDYSGADLILSAPLSGLNLYGGDRDYPPYEQLSAYNDPDGILESSDTVTNIVVQGGFFNEETDQMEEVPTSVHLSGKVYGDVILGSQWNYQFGGNVTIDGDFANRILLDENVRITGNLSVSAANNGIFVFVGAHYDSVSDEWIDDAYLPYTAADFPDLVAGEVELTGATSVTIPAGPFDGAFGGNVVVTNTIYGDVYINGGIVGDLTFQSPIYGKVILSGESYNPTSIGGKLTVAAGNNGVYVSTHSEEFGTVLTPWSEWNESGSEIYTERTATVGTVEVSSDPSPVSAWQVESFDLEVLAGVGGAGTTTGGAGGSVVNSGFYSHENAFSSLTSNELEWVVKAGDGGSGTLTGGAGGSLTKVATAAFASDRFVQYDVLAGDGGDGGVTGGKGGNTTVSFQASQGLSDIFEFVEFKVSAGAGGDGGKIGGAGGSVTSSDISSNSGSNNTSSSHTLAGSVTAGSGGTAGTGINSLAGAAGSLTTVAISTDTAEIKLVAGDAGDGGLKGVAGGSISGVSLTSFSSANFELTAGNGSTGGAGGNIEKISDANHQAFSYVGDDGKPVYTLSSANYSLSLRAGDGSVGETVSGAGGNIKTVSLVAPNYSEQFLMTAGKGADGVKPGAGGIVDTINILSKASATAYVQVAQDKYVSKKVTASLDPQETLGTVTLASGDGGANTETGAGAKGGDIENVSWNLDQLTRILAFGQGGSGNPFGANGVPIKVNAPAGGPTGDGGGDNG